MNKSTRGAAGLVAAGILLSRVAGLVRDRVFAYYFGVESDAFDAFRSATRIPNFLQNLLGEGVLSASFIPVYASLLAREDEEEAGRVAGAIFAILALLTSVLVLTGMLATPFMIEAIAPGFHGAKRELTIRLVRILFPGVGLLVLSAWCLGVLNSHRRFFLSYSAPVLWNASMIAGLLYFGRRSTLDQLAVRIAWVSVVGSAAQFLVQLPTVRRVAPAIRVRLQTHSEHIRTVVRNFGPVFVGRGVAQISGYVDNLLASLLGTGAVSALSYAQTLSMLPVSLFGMAVSASELPAMSSAIGSREEVAGFLRKRLTAGLRRISFFVVPSVVAFALLGDIVAAGVYQGGRFTHEGALYLWAILAGSAIGLLASTRGRLYSSAFYALKDTRTPLRFAIIRVVLTTSLGYLCAKPLPQMLGLDLRWGVAGLTASAGVSGWVEYALLRRALQRVVGNTDVEGSYMARLWVVAMAGAAVAWAVKLLLPPVHPIILAILALGSFGFFYLSLADPSTMGPAALKRLVRRT